MEYIIIFLLLSTCSIFGISFFNKKYEEFLSINIFSIILIMFLFFMMNKLELGLILIYFISILMYIASIINIIARRIKLKDVFCRLFSPGFIIFLLCYIVLIVVTKDFYVTLWDELRLWALYPKSLFIYNDINLTNMGTMSGRVPGMPLLMYFVTKTFGIFKDSLLFLSYGLVSISVLLPLAKSLTWKKWYFIPILVILFFFFPMAFANSGLDYGAYYRTLFIDPLLGILFGYSIYLVFKGFKDKVNLICYIMILCILPLFKETGILLSILSIVSYILSLIALKNRNKGKNNKKELIAIILIPLIIIISWLIFKKPDFSISAEGIESFNVFNTLFSLIKNPSIEQKEVLKNFIYAFNHSNILNLRFEKIEINLWILLIFFTSFFAIVCKTIKKSDIKKYIYCVIILYISVTCTILCNLFYYLFVIKVVESFNRYTSTIIVAMSIFIFCVLINNGKFEIKKNLNNKILLLYLGLIFLLCPIWIPRIYYIPEYFEARKTEQDKSREYISSLDVKENGKVLIIHSGSYSKIMSLNFAYMAIEYKLISSENDLFILDDGTEELEKLLDENDYDYIYFCSEKYITTDKLSNYISTMESGKLYEIIKNDSEYEFREVLKSN